MLQWEIAPLLIRPVGRPPKRPVILYDDFWYRAEVKQSITTSLAFMITTVLCYSATLGANVTDYGTPFRVDMGNVGYHIVGAGLKPALGRQSVTHIWPHHGDLVLHHFV